MDPAPALSTAGPGSPLRLHWRSLTDGLLVSFLISGTSLFSSLILRDDKERMWYLPLLAAAAGFVIGGAIAGRHRRTPRGAIYQGAAIGLLTATVVLMADVIRHAVEVKHGPGHTTALWVAIEVASILVSTSGGLIGRWLYLRSRRRKTAGVR